MARSFRRAGVTAVVLVCALPASPALAQGDDRPFTGPPLEEEFPGGSGSQQEPTPTPTPSPRPARTPEPTPAASRTATPEPTATSTPEPTPTPKPKRNGGRDLPNTGSDPLRVGLMGLTLLGFGLSLRFGMTGAGRPD